MTSTRGGGGAGVLTDEEIEEATGAMKLLVSPDLRNKEAGLRHLIDLFLQPAYRALFDARPEWTAALKDELLHSASEIVSMLSMWALSHLALDAGRCAALASDDVVACARDVLGASFNSDLIEKTLWLLLNLSHARLCVQRLTGDARLCAYLTDLAGSENAAVQLAAVKVLHLFASGPHALLFRAVFCRKRGFRTLCATMDAHDRCSRELLVSVLNLTYALITASEPDVTIKKLFIVGGLLSSLEGVATLPDYTLKNKVIVILINLASSFPESIKEFENNGIVELARRTLFDAGAPVNTAGLAAVLMRIFIKNKSVAEGLALTGFCESVVALLDTEQEYLIIALLELASTMALTPVLKCELLASRVLSRLARMEVELSARLPPMAYQTVLKAINDCRTLLRAPVDPETMAGVLDIVRKQAATTARSQTSQQKSYIQRVWTSARSAQGSGDLGDSANSNDYNEPKQQQQQQQHNKEDELTEKRFNVAHEILDTEQRYVKSLQQCIENHMKTLRNNYTILNKATVDALFSNIQEVYLHNRRFLKMLEDKMEGWNDQCCLGDLFCTFFVGYTKDVYSTYINNFDSALDLYYKLMDENPDFNAFVMARKKTLGLDLSSYLIMPVQRIPRYLLLLGTLLEATPEDHPDRKGLQVAATKARQLTDEINENKRITEERRKWTETEKQLDTIPASLAANNATRRLIKKGLLIESNTSRSSHYIVLLLVSDAVLITSQQKKKLKVSKVVPLAGVSVEKALPSFDGTVVHAFAMTSPEHTYTFCANNPEERDEWLTAFQSALTLASTSNGTESSQPTPGNTGQPLSQSSSSTAPLAQANTFVPALG